MMNEKSILKPGPIGVMKKWIKDSNRAYFENRIYNSLDFQLLSMMVSGPIYAPA